MEAVIQSEREEVGGDRKRRKKKEKKKEEEGEGSDGSDLSCV